MKFLMVKIILGRLLHKGIIMNPFKNINLSAISQKMLTKNHALLLRSAGSFEKKDALNPINSPKQLKPTSPT